MSATPESGEPRIAWLHIGLHKTGTTALQRSLRLGREALAARGVGTPDLGPDPGWPLIHWAAADRSPSRNPRRAAHAGPEARTAVAAQMTALMEDRSLRALVLSAEQFAGRRKRVDVEALKARLEAAGWQVRALAYLRPAADYAVSMISQRIKAGATLAEASARPPLPRARAVLRPWLRVLGPRALHLRRYDPSAFPDGDVLRDFALALDLPAGALPAPPTSARNARPSARAIAVLDRYNQALTALRPGLARARPPRWHAALAVLGGPPWTPPPELARRIAELALEDDAWAARRLARQTAASA